MVTKEFITLKLSEIKPYPNNPRINDEAVNDVIASIEQCEYIDPIEIDEDSIILSGHTRYKALNKLKYKECDVIRVKGLTDDEKRKYRLLANKTNERALWDSDKLEIELDGLDFSDFDLSFDNIFSIDDIAETNAYNFKEDTKEYFEKTFTFPITKKQQIINYLKKHYEEVISRIIHDAEVNY